MKPDKKLELQLPMDAIVNLIRGGNVRFIYNDIEVNLYPKEKGIFLSEEEAISLQRNVNPPTSIVNKYNNMYEGDSEKYIIQNAENAIKVLTRRKDFAKKQIIEELLLQLKD